VLGCAYPAFAQEACTQVSSPDPELESNLFPQLRVKHKEMHVGACDEHFYWGNPRLCDRV
jgi:hypothetical protein